MGRAAINAYIVGRIVRKVSSGWLRKFSVFVRRYQGRHHKLNVLVRQVRRSSGRGRGVSDPVALHRLKNALLDFIAWEARENEWGFLLWKLLTIIGLRRMGFQDATLIRVSKSERFLSEVGDPFLWLYYWESTSSYPDDLFLEEGAIDRWMLYGKLHSGQNLAHRLFLFLLDRWGFPWTPRSCEVWRVWLDLCTRLFADYGRVDAVCVGREVPWLYLRLMTLRVRWLYVKRQYEEALQLIEEKLQFVRSRFAYSDFKQTRNLWIRAWLVTLADQTNIYFRMKDLVRAQKTIQEAQRIMTTSKFSEYALHFAILEFILYVLLGEEGRARALYRVLYRRLSGEVGDTSVQQMLGNLLCWRMILAVKHHRWEEAIHYIERIKPYLQYLTYNQVVMTCITGILVSWYLGLGVQARSYQERLFHLFHQKKEPLLFVDECQSILRVLSEAEGGHRRQHVVHACVQLERLFSRQQHGGIRADHDSFFRELVASFASAP